MIGQSIIPAGYSPSYECLQWLHSEHRRIEQLRREAYDNAAMSEYDKSKWEHFYTLMKFEDITWNALYECSEAQRKATDKLLAETKAFLAELAVEPDYSNYSGISF